MKDRNRKGKFRRIESVTYKMAKHTGFDAVSWMAFQEAALEKYASEEEEEEFKQGGCPDGFRSKGSQTISGKRREVCCTPDGKVCMTADGIPL